MLCALACPSNPTQAATHYVWSASPSPASPYTNWATAAHTIQDAVDAAVAGEEIVVTNGIYATGGRAVYGTMTNRVAVDKPVILRSVNGPEVTVIQGHQVPGTTNGDGAIRCVYLTNGAVLSGFTLTNGGTRISGDFSREQVGGGVRCESTNVVVANCILVGNLAQGHGGGAAYGTLNQCILTGNTARLSGGGAYEGILSRCILTANRAGFGGGWAAFTGGGNGPTLNNCLLTTNWAGFGGGTYYGLLNNCTLVGNFAITNGGGAFRATMNNCIAQFNRGEYGWTQANYFESVLNYCCTVPLPTGGIANITNEPAFVDPAAGNYHLRCNSQCIDAGTNLSAIITNDLDGNPRLLDGNGDGTAAFDMGAYEYNAQIADDDADGSTTFQEWIADTIPTNALSVLRIASISNGPPVVVEFTSSSNRLYTLRSAPNLTGASWADVPGQTDVPGSGGWQALRDTNAAPARFYRVGVRMP